jgi:hypothetical protein
MFEFEISVAKANWLRWQAIFEHAGTARDNPLLAQSDLFEQFVKEYSVRRTIRRGTRETLRLKLIRPDYDLEGMIIDCSGRALDVHETALRKDFGTKLGWRSMRSAVSKVAAFLAPGTFVAWDKYARQGLNQYLGRARSSKFDTYTSYLAELNSLSSSSLGDDIRQACRGNYPSEFAASGERFHRRVLDVHLMLKGGRDFNKSIAGRAASRMLVDETPSALSRDCTKFHR